MRLKDGSPCEEFEVQWEAPLQRVDLSIQSIYFPRLCEPALFDFTCCSGHLETYLVEARKRYQKLSTGCMVLSISRKSMWFNIESIKYIELHFITFNCVELHSIRLHSLHWITFDHIYLYFITLEHVSLDFVEQQHLFTINHIQVHWSTVTFRFK